MRRPVVYDAWWQMVEACSRLRGDLASVSWYSVPAGDGQGFEVGGRVYTGYWYEGGNRIAVVAEREFEGPLVRHEMLHALLRRGDHPRDAFVEHCGAVVACPSDCDAIGEAGRGVPGNASEVTPASLEMSITPTPAAPSVAADSGWFTLTVSARNPSAVPVWVQLPDAQTFGYMALTEGYAGTYRTTSEPRFAFRAGETRRFVFDLQYPAGAYGFYGFFARQSSPTLTVIVGP